MYLKFIGISLSFNFPTVHTSIYIPKFYTKYMRHSRTQTNGKDMEIEIEGMKTEEVRKTKYLGTTVTRFNLIEEEIKERIAAGNRASFANQKILHSKLIF